MRKKYMFTETLKRYVNVILLQHSILIIFLHYTHVTQKSGILSIFFWFDFTQIIFQ